MQRTTGARSQEKPKSQPSHILCALGTYARRVFGDVVPNVTGHHGSVVRAENHAVHTVEPGVVSVYAIVTVVHDVFVDTLGCHDLYALV